jgi:MFS family permease
MRLTWPAGVDVAVAATVLGNLPLWLLTGLAPRMAEELGFSSVGLGIAVGVYFGISAVTAFVAGHFVERVGWRLGMLASSIICCVTTVGMGLATTWTTLVVLLGVSALGFAVVQPAANLAVAQMVPPERQGVAFGVKQAALPLTTLLVGASVPLFEQPGGWRWAFASAAGLSALLAGVLVVQKRSGRRSPSVRATTVSPDTNGRKRRMRPPRALVCLAVGAGFGSAATGSLGGFLPSYGVEMGLDPSEAGRLLVLASVVCLLVRLVSGYAADRRGRRHLYVSSLMMLAGALGFALLSVGGWTWTLIVGAVVAFGIGWAWNGVFAFAIVLNYNHFPATATGVVQTAISTGAALGPFGFGVAATASGYAWAWVLAGTSLACGGGVVAFGRRMLARDAR